MKLSEYIKTSPLSNQEAIKSMALLLGCSEITIRSWASGKRYPSSKWWKNIETATSGHVSIKDFVE